METTVEPVQYEGVYDYTQAQREGKSTLMVYHAVNILIEEYRTTGKWREIWCNFHLFVPRANCVTSDMLIREMVRIKKEKRTHILIIFDELSQKLMSRSFGDRLQTIVASFLWQCPKRDIIFIYGSNLGKSVDRIIRLATTESFLPHYMKGDCHENDRIKFAICDNRKYREKHWITLHGVSEVQTLFRSREPVE